ncbi:MAG: hypothetical protein JNL26_10235 [Gemmatimonadetes bacterium]|nr:hypothetical protein [Gemmatimonadota bacterium]
MRRRSGPRGRRREVWMTRAMSTAALLAACSAPAPVVDQSRSGGLPVAELPVERQVAAYEAAVRTAFDVGPDLYLLAHVRRLPRGAGTDGGDSLPAALGEALRRAGTIRGTCDPARDGDQRAPRCDATRSGYVIRATEIFQGGGDTLRMNLLSELYAAANGPGQEPFAFEMAYKLVPREDGRFRVVAEGRVREKR